MTVDDASIYCPYCHSYTALSKARGADVSGEHIQGYSIYYCETGKWWIGICNNCQKGVLIHEIDMGHGYEIKEIFPQPLAKLIDDRIPDFIKNDLEEANKCMSIQAYRATCGLARRILQLICLDKGATEGKKLHQQIDELFENGDITKDIKEWAHSVRFVGNDALHPNKDTPIIERDDAEVIMNLVEQIVHILYIASTIAEEKRTKFKK